MGRTPKNREEEMEDEDGEKAYANGVTIEDFSDVLDATVTREMTAEDKEQFARLIERGPGKAVATKWLRMVRESGSMDEAEQDAILKTVPRDLRPLSALSLWAYIVVRFGDKGTKSLENLLRGTHANVETVLRGKSAVAEEESKIAWELRHNP